MVLSAAENEEDYHDEAHAAQSFTPIKVLKRLTGSEAVNNF